MPLRTAALPRMAGLLSFMRAPVVGLAELRPGMIAALGVPLDGCAPGAGLTRFGPTALRETSAYFGSHFSANMQAAMDIDRRRVLQGGLMTGGLVDLGDLCLEGLAPPAAGAAIGSATAAVAARGALPLLLGGDAPLVTAALAGLDTHAGTGGPGAGLALVQLGTRDCAAPDGVPTVRLGPAGARALASAAQDGPPVRTDAAAAAAAGPSLAAGEAARALLAATAQGRSLFVAFDLSALAAPWHGMNDRAGFDGLGLRELRRAVAALAALPLAGIAITGLDATRSGLSTVKTGQRLILTALLDLLYQRLLPPQAAAQP